MTNGCRAERLTKLPPYLFAQLDVAKKQAEARGTDVINLGIGDPDLPTPPEIISRLAAAAGEPRNHRYPPYQGTAAFRAAVAAWYKKRFQVALDPEREVVALIGSKEGIAHISLGVLNQGDTVLIPDPSYPVYQAGAIFAGASVRHMSLRKENGFLPDLNAIDEEVADKARLLWLNYPNNPTAAGADQEFFRRVIAFARAHDIIVCHDCAYSELSYDGYTAPSILQVPGALQQAVEFHSLSKSFSMTGWRIGFAVGSGQILDALRDVKTNVDSGVFQAIQEAGIEALARDDELISPLRSVYAKRRDILVGGLRGLGWEVPLPRATFYVWMKVPNRMKSLDFSAYLLEELGILVTPGVGFGPSGEGYVRAALTVDEARLEEAISRLQSIEL